MDHQKTIKDLESIHSLLLEQVTRSECMTLKVKDGIRTALDSTDLSVKLRAMSQLMAFIESDTLQSLTPAEGSPSSPAPIRRIPQRDHSSTPYKRLSCDKHYNGKRKCDPETCYENRNNACEKHINNGRLCGDSCRRNKLVSKKEQEREQILRESQEDDENDFTIEHSTPNTTESSADSENTHKEAIVVSDDEEFQYV